MKFGKLWIIWAINFMVNLFMAIETKEIGWINSACQTFVMTLFLWSVERAENFEKKLRETCEDENQEKYE